MMLYVSLAVFLVLLVFYIIALKKSKKGDLVLTANGWDMVMLLLCPLTIFVAWCMGFDHLLNTAQIIFLSIAALCFLGTCIMSVVHNSGHFMGIVISVLAKVFIVLLTLVALLILIMVFVVTVLLTFTRNHDDDEEYILLKYDRALRAYVGYKV